MQKMLEGLIFPYITKKNEKELEKKGTRGTICREKKNSFLGVPLSALTMKEQ